MSASPRKGTPSPPPIKVIVSPSVANPVVLLIFQVLRHNEFILKICVEIGVSHYLEKEKECIIFRLNKGGNKKENQISKHF